MALCRDHRNKLDPIKFPFCYYCSRPLGENIHEADQLRVSNEPVCGACRKRKIILNKVLAGFRFEHELQRIVADWKFGARTEWGRWLGRKLWSKIKNRLRVKRWEWLVPVPLHRRRRMNRGFNQARQLAEALSKLTKLDIKQLLQKHRRTHPQSELSREERQENLNDAFSLSCEEWNQATPVDSVLLVDDIYTTGSTLRTTAKVLIDGGVNRVGAVVLARAVLD